MDRPRDECFPKKMRLRKRQEFLLLQKNGQKVHTSSFLALLNTKSSEDELDHLNRLGITTTKRIGNAPVRNRIRRVIREAFRKKMIWLPQSTDLVIIAKKTASAISNEAIFSELRFLGKKIKKVYEEQL